MSLWTPDGERPVGRPDPEPAAPTGAGVAGMTGAPSLEDLSPEERERVEAYVARMAEVQEEIARTPIAALVANHGMGLYELAAIKLSQQPPLLDEARVAIDALAAMLEGVGSRLGDDGRALQEALTQLQMAFVQLADGSSAGDGSA